MGSIISNCLNMRLVLFLSFLFVNGLIPVTFRTDQLYRTLENLETLADRDEGQSQGHERQKRIAPIQQVLNLHSAWFHMCVYNGECQQISNQQQQQQPEPYVQSSLEHLLNNFEKKQKILK